MFSIRLHTLFLTHSNIQSEANCLMYQIVYMHLSYYTVQMGTIQISLNYEYMWHMMWFVNIYSEEYCIPHNQNIHGESSNQSLEIPGRWLRKRCSGSTISSCPPLIDKRHGNKGKWFRTFFVFFSITILLGKCQRETRREHDYSDSHI